MEGYLYLYNYDLFTNQLIWHCFLHFMKEKAVSRDLGIHWYLEKELVWRWWLLLLWFLSLMRKENETALKKKKVVSSSLCEPVCRLQAKTVRGGLRKKQHKVLMAWDKFKIKQLFYFACFLNWRSFLKRNRVVKMFFENPRVFWI